MASTVNSLLSELSSFPLFFCNWVTLFPLLSNILSFVSAYVHIADILSAAFALTANSPSGIEIPDKIKATAIITADILLNHPFFLTDFFMFSPFPGIKYYDVTLLTRDSVKNKIFDCSNTCHTLCQSYTKKCLIFLFKNTTCTIFTLPNFFYFIYQLQIFSSFICLFFST